MKKGYLYTIIFMGILAAVLTALLATANTVMGPTIKENQSVALQANILSAFGIEHGEDNQAIKDTFGKYVKPAEQTIDGKKVAAYQQVDDSGAPQGYAFPFEGSGLWGTIRGYLATSQDLKTIKGIAFTEQNETPGLGGRIDETEFREQWRGVPLLDEPIDYGTVGDKKLDAISGATQTSSSITRIVNQLKKDVISKWEVK